MTSLVAIVQARMTSSRLPGKVLADICGKAALQRQIERIQQAKRVDKIMVATTTNASDDPIVELCGRLGVDVFRGDEADVLERFRGAAEAAGATAVVRLTADCPMIDPDVLDGVVELFNEGCWDYVSNCNERTFPDGLDVEVFTRAALEEAAEKATAPFQREHVTPYMRGMFLQYVSGEFRIAQYTYPADFSHVRWTLDTVDDLERIRRLIAQLPEDYTWLQALSVATRQPELLGPQGT